MDTILQKNIAPPYFTVYTSRPTVNSPRLMQRSHLCLRTHLHALERRRRLSMAFMPFKRRRWHSNTGTGRYQKSIIDRFQ